MLPQRYQRLKKVLGQRQPDLTVLTEDVHKSHNFSAIVRTCDAVGILEVHAVNTISELPDLSPVAKGSEKWVNLQIHPNIITAITHLKQQHFRIYAAHLSEEAIDYRSVDYTRPTAILMGAEKWGVSNQAATLADHHITIPMMGMVQSLNVSVAAAVILFEVQRQRLIAGFYDHVRLDCDRYDQLLFEWGYPQLAEKYRTEGKTYPILNEQGNILPPY